MRDCVVTKPSSSHAIAVGWLKLVGYLLAIDFLIVIIVGFVLLMQPAFPLP